MGGKEAQDIEREKQPINDRAAGCAVQHKRVLILNNADICISNIFDIFKWIFKSKVVPAGSRLNSSFRLGAVIPFWWTDNRCHL